MPKFKILYPSGATPIDPNELKDLIPDYISTMSELNQLEQSNIADGFIWIGKQNLDDLLSVTFILKVHEKMFNQVWKWAGKIRTTNKNIGVMKESIMTNLAILIGNTKFWIENKTFSNEEVAVKFHHRLVQIHIFSNGNGRHARLMTDLLLLKLGENKFTWGSLSIHTPLEVEGKTRSEYIAALKKADKDDFADLIKFVKS